MSHTLNRRQWLASAAAAAAALVALAIGAVVAIERASSDEDGGRDHERTRDGSSGDVRARPQQRDERA